LKATLAWLNDALSAKDLVAGMTHYCVSGGEILATNGRITAGHPWPFDGEFLVPGNEFEKILKHMPNDPIITVDKDYIKLRSGRFSGKISTLPLDLWNHSTGIDGVMWRPIPGTLLGLLELLRPFISDNAVHPWATTVALQDGWAYASNNIAIAGAPGKGLGGVHALLPTWAIDFIVARSQGCSQWAWADHFVAFKWENGAWMRSQLVVGTFPERAAAMVRAAKEENPTQEITAEFRMAFEKVVGLTESTVEIYADRIEGKFGKAMIEDAVACKAPSGAPCSVWGAEYLAPALRVATHWSPELWPQPVPFKGSVLSGYVVGRRM